MNKPYVEYSGKKKEEKSSDYRNFLPFLIDWAGMILLSGSIFFRGSYIISQGQYSEDIVDTVLRAHNSLRRPWNVLIAFTTERNKLM